MSREFAVMMLQKSVIEPYNLWVSREVNAT